MGFGKCHQSLRRRVEKGWNLNSEWTAPLSGLPLHICFTHLSYFSQRRLLVNMFLENNKWGGVRCSHNNARYSVSKSFLHLFYKCSHKFSNFVLHLLLLNCCILPIKKKPHYIGIIYSPSSCLLSKYWHQPFKSGWPPLQSKHLPVVPSLILLPSPQSHLVESPSVPVKEWRKRPRRRT